MTGEALNVGRQVDSGTIKCELDWTELKTSGGMKTILRNIRVNPPMNEETICRLFMSIASELEMRRVSKSNGANRLFLPGSM